MEKANLAFSVFATRMSALYGGTSTYAATAQVGGIRILHLHHHRRVDSLRPPIYRHACMSDEFQL